MLSNSRRLDESSLHLTGVLKRRGENIGTHPVEGGDAEGCSYKPRDPQDRWEPPESEEEARKLPPLEPAGERALLTPRLQTFSFQNCERIRFCGFCTQHVILCTAALNLKHHATQFRELSVPDLTWVSGPGEDTLEIYNKSLQLMFTSWRDRHPQLDRADCCLIGG